MKPPRIVVVGSINVDMVMRGDRLPLAGETRKAREFTLTLGGKGANQAIAAARLGADVLFIAKLGADAFGDLASGWMAGFGLDLRAIARDPAQTTGVATIFVDDMGQNAIAIVGGANDALTQADLALFAADLARADVLLLQCETPLDTSLAAAEMVRSGGGVTVLDPAPVPTGGLPEALYRAVDIITPNETESQALLGPAAADSAAAAEELVARGAGAAVIKLGKIGGYFRHSGASGAFPAFDVTAIDTVAAGDCFNAGLAVALGRRIAFAEALRFASACGALATTRIGAAAAAPALADVERFLEERRALGF